MRSSFPDTGQAPADAIEADLINPTHHPDPAGASRSELKAVSETQTPDQGVPEAVAEAHHRHAQKGLSSSLVGGRGVRWVHPSELLTQGSGRVAGAGINLQAALGYRAQRLGARSLSATARGVRRLPPVTAFGRARTPDTAPTRGSLGHT